MNITYKNLRCVKNKIENCDKRRKSIIEVFITNTLHMLVWRNINFILMDKFKHPVKEILLMSIRGNI